MLALATALLVSQSDGARATLEFVRDRYLRCGSFTMTVVHHDSSGLYPGDYTQDLRYLKPGRFELKVKRKSDFVPRAESPGNLAPDFFSDGKTVVLIKDKVILRTASLEVDPNTMPGWEVAGGPILGWMLGSPTSKSYLDPPENLKIAMRFGDRTRWQNEDVREIAMVLGDPQVGLKVSFFVDRLAQKLVGFEWMPGGRVGWARYTKQEFNPKMPSDLGKPPSDTRTSSGSSSSL